MAHSPCKSLAVSHTVSYVLSPGQRTSEAENSHVPAAAQTPDLSTEEKTLTNTALFGRRQTHSLCLQNPSLPRGSMALAVLREECQPHIFSALLWGRLHVGLIPFHFLDALNKCTHPSWQSSEGELVYSMKCCHF